MTIHLLSQTHNVKPRHTPPASMWGALVSALQTYANNHEIYLNDLGENTPESPLAAAEIVKNGGIYVDWCGWPFFASSGVGANGFKNFLNYGGLAAPAGLSFDSGGTGDPYVRSLVTSGPLNSNFVVNSMASNGGSFYASSFAVKMGKGLYFYAFGNDGSTFASFGLGPSDGLGVPVSQYAPFINSEIRKLQSLSGSTGGVPNCTKWGTYVKPGEAAGTYEFVQYGNGQAVYNIVDFNCNRLASYTHASPGTPLPTGGGSGGNYPAATAEVNGKPFPAIAYGHDFTTCLLYTVLDKWNITYTIDYANHIFTLSNGAQVQGIVSNGTTYLPWDQIPGVTATPLQTGGNNFTFSGLPSKGGSGNGSSGGANGTMGLILAAGGILAAYYVLKHMQQG